MTTESRTIEFHRTFGHPVRTEPQTISRAEAILALRLIEEEFIELTDALFPGAYDGWITELRADGEGRHLTEDRFHKELARWVADGAYSYEPDLIKVADAVGDLDVVNNGCGIRHGLDMQAISREVFRSNMSKLGDDGKPIYDEGRKIVKGPNFTEPNLAAVLGIEVSK